MHTAIDIPDDQIAAFCEKWKVVELSLFGSVLRDDFGPGSDVDVLVEFLPGARVTLLRFVAMERELSAILARRVDLVMREALAEHPEDPRTRAILSTAEVLYAA